MWLFIGTLNTLFPDRSFVHECLYASTPLCLYVSMSLCFCVFQWNTYSTSIYFINVEAYFLISNLINALWGNASVWKFKRIPRRAISHFLFCFFPFSEFITVNVSRLRYIIYWSRHARRIAALSNNSYSIKMIKQQTLEYISMVGDRMRFFSVSWTLKQLNASCFQLSNQIINIIFGIRFVVQWRHLSLELICYTMSVDEMDKPAAVTIYRSNTKT